MIDKDGFYIHDDASKRRLPPEMTELNRWCCFKVGKANERGKRPKKPCYENGKGADHNKKLLTKYGKKRVGFLFDVEDDNAEYQQVFIDCDGKPDPKYADFYSEIFEELQEATTCEHSLSSELDGKKSFHAFGYAKLPIRGYTKDGKPKTARSCSKLSIELYDRARWCLTTGITNEVTMNKIQEIVVKIIAKMDEIEAEELAEKTKKVSKRTNQRRAKQLGNVKVEKLFIADDDIDRVKKRLHWHRQPENKNLLNQSGDYIAWQRVVYSLKSMIDKEGNRVFKDGDIVEFCSQQPGFDSKAFNDILTGFKDGGQGVQDANFFALSNDRGYPQGLDTPNNEVEKTDRPKPEKSEFYRFDATKMADLSVPQDLTEWFPPIGESSVICGKPGAGKTSLLMHAIADATKRGLKVLVWSFDMRHEFLAQYLAAYGAKSEHVIIVDQVIELGKIESLIVEEKIDCFVPDPFLDFFGVAASRFMTNPLTGKEQEFNPDQQYCWVKAFSWFRQWAKILNISVLGTLHSAKGKYGHDLPHSGKLPAYLWKWWILYRKGFDMRAHPERWLVAHLERGEEDTRLLYNGKVRGSSEIRHMLYNFGEEADEAILTPGIAMKPRAIVNISHPKENDKDEDDLVLGADSGRKFPSVDAIRAYSIGDHNTEWVTTTRIQEHFNERDEVGRYMVLGRLMAMARDGRIECEETRVGKFRWRIGCKKP